MKILTGLLACLFVTGCMSSASKGTPTAISIQMSFDDVPAILAMHGARHVTMDGLKKEDAVDRFYCYNLVDGRVVVMGVSKMVNRISRLSVCELPKEAKGKRIWTDIASVELALGRK